MRQSEPPTDPNYNHDYVSKRKNSHQFYQIGQLRRAKLHAARLIEFIDTKRVLPPSLYRLLEASLVLETTDTKILAACLKQSPTTIRGGFQRIFNILEHAGELQKTSTINIKI
jgi:hypothetical protein